ncbi:MAG TPA: ABC transporter ATP-binding protein [Thermoanaerobaculia bacterium]|nr:ABC transporter ATP-binding protein [Thermoanaerobaculia bacterium]
MARMGLLGGGVSSRVPRGEGRRGGKAQEDEKKKKKAPPFRAILHDAAELIAARRGRLGLGLGVLFINRLAGFVIPFMPRYLLDEVLAKGRRELLPTLVAAAAGATVIQAITSYSLSQILGKAAQRSITEMRRAVQRHVGRLSVSYFDQTKVGALLSRVMTDAEGIRNLVGTGLVEVVGGLLTAVIALVILLALNLKLTAIALAVLSLFGFILLYAFKTLRPLFRERSKINAEVSGRLTESFSGIRVVKAYRAEKREALVFSKGVHRLFRNVAQTMTGFSAVTAFSTILFGTISVSILWVGSNDVLAGRMTMGALFQFTALLAMLVGPVVQIVSIGSQITEAFAGLERIREIRNEMAEDSGDEARSDLPPIRGEVEFRDVTFEYKPGVPVLHGISFIARPGTSTALVGPSGSGKSTLIGLVAAFYRPASGEILVDGQDLSKVKLADYRSQLGVVLQDNFLFDGTVFENIAYARPDATDEEVLRAAKISRCDDFVQRLPEKYETVVGERGVKLSGGERQRVAIARAILADPRILILDEATSSLDSENEAAIQQGLAELMKGRTTFVIAHRLSTIRKADAILVLEDGRIVERGRHEDLLARGGRYADLYTRQYGIEANIFRNPGESEKEEEAETPRATADSTIGRLPLVGSGRSE